MKNLTTTLTTLLLLSFLTNCTDQNPSTSGEAEPSLTPQEAAIERGEYLVKIIGCDHCHTPKKMTAEGPVPDMDRWLMGYPGGDELPEIDQSEIGPGKWVLLNGDLTAAVGPWGVTFGANLTPDVTGIGEWTYQNFKKAMTEGKHKGLEDGRPVLPPMPWQSYREMKEEDLEAIFAYLQSIKPIENLVPEYIPLTGMK